MSNAPSQPEVDAEEALPVRFGELLAGKYRVDTLLGRGGMAVVLAGTHVQLDAPIAIKVLLPSRASNADAVRRFLSEARAAAQLKSENVARISDVGTAPTKSGSLPFIVMERLDGVDFAMLMEQKKKLSFGDALDFARQASRGLEEAHARGIIHRDIKPANLFLTKTPEGAPLVKVLDFGISKTIASIGAAHQRAITGDNEAMGSPGYMSPEQVKAAKDVDVRTDIWSLGVVLHELLSGRHCFDGDELPDIFAAILHGEPPALDEAIPANVRAVVRRCLQKDANKRYASAAELTQALGEAMAPPQRKRIPLVAVGIGVVAMATVAAVFARPAHEMTPAPAAALAIQNAVTTAGISPSSSAAAPTPAARSASSVNANVPGLVTPSAARTSVSTAPSPLPKPSAAPPPSATPSVVPQPRQRTDW